MILAYCDDIYDKILNKMKKQILTEEFRRMRKLAGLITENEYKNRTAEELFKMFKDEDLLDDRREYDVDDLLDAYPGLSKKEAEKLVTKLQDV